ncbi:hypothetical protein ACLKOZ_05080 [Arthrobacter sp. R4]|uniref:hypothetical protein n=1 Tax=Arthrobacter sp. R4 TaxID=644417 RepID=UPI003ED9DC0A
MQEAPDHMNWSGASYWPGSDQGTLVAWGAHPTIDCSTSALLTPQKGAHGAIDAAVRA